MASICCVSKSGVRVACTVGGAGPPAAAEAPPFESTGGGPCRTSGRSGLWAGTCGPGSGSSSRRASAAATKGAATAASGAVSALKSSGSSLPTSWRSSSISDPPIIWMLGVAVGMPPSLPGARPIAGADWPGMMMLAPVPVSTVGLRSTSAARRL